MTAIGSLGAIVWNSSLEGARYDGDLHEVLMLTPPTDERTVKLERAIRQEGQARGREVRDTPASKPCSARREPRQSWRRLRISEVPVQAPARLEDLTPGARVRGVLPDRAVTVVQVEWHGTQALTLTYRDDDGQGRPRAPLPRRRGRARDRGRRAAPGASTPTASSSGSPPRRCGSGSRTCSTRTSPSTPRTSSRCRTRSDAVYGEMLPRQPLRFLLADDPGAGKTIMAGLLIKELIVRGDLERCLIVAPGSLVEQWQDELAQKFGLDFEILTRDTIEASRSGNPFAEKNLVIARLDQLVAQRGPPGEARADRLGPRRRRRGAQDVGALLSATRSRRRSATSSASCSAGSPATCC